jgi:ribosomal protein S18 acetylase RimI-like enzyme
LPKAVNVGNSSQTAAWEIAAADPLQDREALALAALAWDQAERAENWREVRAAAHLSPPDVALLTARRAGHLQAAAIGRILPGRAAIVWPVQLAGVPLPESPPIAGLVAELHRRMADRGAKIAQAILAAGDDVGRQRLTDAGYWHAADLLCMSGEAGCFPPYQPELPFELRPAAGLTKEQLLAVIDATYQQTLDCPRIDGLRTTADVLAGHYAVGEYRPDYWHVAWVDGQPAGCLFVNLHADLRHAELVYLGLIPAARGRRYGQQLTRHALWLARQAGCQRLVLAVDATNAPAIAAYRAAGLVAWDRRAIWVHVLGNATADTAAS